ncbi:MAG: DinB family protein [Acidimicrobiia bacterium]|nr:DinB family protein [Acidimicrobiia bacterium]
MYLSPMRYATLLITLLLSPATAQIPPEVGQGWLPEFTHSANQILALAEAVPADKYSWRPAPGVRSFSEVCMHVALGNYFLLGHAGIKPKSAPGPVSGELEKKITEKKEVIAWLKESIAAVKEAYPSADLEKKLRFFNQDSTIGNVFLRILVHSHEHMGQSVAYARIMGVAPPWSR